MQAAALDVLEGERTLAGREERDPVRGGPIQVRRNCERDVVVEMKILPAGAVNGRVSAEAEASALRQIEKGHAHAEACALRQIENAV